MLLTLVLVPNLQPTTFRSVFVPKLLQASTLVATGGRTTRNPPLHAADSQTLTCGLVFYSCRHSTTLVEKRIKTNCAQWKVSLFSLADLTPCDTHKVLFGVEAVMSHHSEKSLVSSILNGFCGRHTITLQVACCGRVLAAVYFFIVVLLFLQPAAEYSELITHTEVNLSV